ncbi:MAG: hypothetical protein IAE97_07485 [Chthoniobacterales bacterium]|nr:hypothetical protein [Chthoniobacterales bacterium]
MEEIRKLRKRVGVLETSLAATLDLLAAQNRMIRRLAKKLNEDDSDLFAGKAMRPRALPPQLEAPAAHAVCEKSLETSDPDGWWDYRLKQQAYADLAENAAKRAELLKKKSGLDGMQL